MNEADRLRLQGATWAEIGITLKENPTKVRKQTLNGLWEERHG